MPDQTLADGLNMPPTNTSATHEWFYIYKGDRKGPVKASDIRRLLNEKELRPEDQVWRSGLSGWVSIRSSELNEVVDLEPPPVAAKNISNGLVWLVALLPLAFGLFDLYLTQLPTQAFHNNFELALMQAFPNGQGPWSIEVIASALLCVWDESNVKKAGYGSKWMTSWAFFLAPIYLFLRAKTLKQWPTYAIVFPVSVLIATIAPISMIGGAAR